MGTILLGGLLIGTIDILWAFGMGALEGRTPIYILQTISGGLLGSEAMKGGLATAGLGLVFHFFIATCVMTVFYLASRRFPILTQKFWLFGPLYGLLVYLVMYQVVLPNSAWHTKGIVVGPGMYKAIFIHLFGVGLIAALVARRASPDARAR
jgi:hypothetical protein